MTKQNVIVSDTGDITKSTINMAITLTLSSKSLFTYAPMPSSPMQKLPSGGFITLSRKKLWEKDDLVKASSTTHIKSPVFFSAVAEDHSSWIVSFQNLHMYNSIVSYGLIKLESFNKIVIKQWQFHHPSALKMFDQITNASKGKQIVMFLDYDGTLSPIVDDPDRAFMSDQMRKVVKEVARYFPTAIVSGRCRAKVYSFVKLAGLFYAGSHGMDIKGPSEYQKGNKPVLFQPASEFLPMIDEVYKALVEKTKSTPGAKVENNKFCLSVHFRRVDEKWWSVLAEQVRSVLKEYPKLRLTQGRKVLEVRPTIKWDKGKALEFLLESLGFANCNDVLPVYIGDDRTDEDAFKVLRDRGQGIGILVSKIPKDTNASYSLQEPSEVMNFLHRLVEWKRLTPRT